MPIFIPWPNTLPDFTRIKWIVSGVCSLVSFSLALSAYLSPHTKLNQISFALLNVSLPGMDGASLLLGPMGSCSKSSSSENLSCMRINHTSLLDVSKLPEDVQHIVQPPAILNQMLFVGGASIILFHVCTIFGALSRIGNIGELVWIKFCLRVGTRLGFVTLAFGALIWLDVRLWFGQAAFDLKIRNPQWQAEVGNAFKIILVAVILNFFVYLLTNVDIRRQNSSHTPITMSIQVETTYAELGPGPGVEVVQIGDATYGIRRESGLVENF